MPDSSVEPPLKIVQKRPGDTKKVNFDVTESTDLPIGEKLSTVNGTPAAVPTGGSPHLVVDQAVISTDGLKLQVRLTLGVAPIGFTADPANDTLDSIAHGLSNGDLVHVLGCDLPAGLSEDIQYYVVNKTADDLQLALCAGGTPVLLKSTGKGFQLGIDYVVTATANTDGGQILVFEAICQLRDRF